jgi:hypothetical protein
MTDTPFSSDWVKARLREAQTASPLVPAATVQLIEVLLRGQFIDQELPSRKLSEIADSLLAETESLEGPKATP